MDQSIGSDGPVAVMQAMPSAANQQVQVICRISIAFCIVYTLNDK